MSTQRLLSRRGVEESQAMTDTSVPSAAASTQSEPAADVAWEQIRDALRGLKYGVISIIVQDGVVVQIERTEKRRIRRS